MIAQKEIAKALGVSAVTVSRALRNHPDLAQETRERILRKAKDLGYLTARTPQKGSAVKRLGLLLYQVNDQTELSEFWMSDSEIPRKILGSLQKEAQRNQIETIFETPTPGQVPLMVQNRTVDVAIIMGRYDPEALTHLRNLPALSVSSYVANNWLARVVVDNFRGMKMVTEHMISLGHRRILFVGAEGSGSTELHRERERGYAHAMYTHGLIPESVMCPGWNVQPIADRLLQASALAVSSDSLALSVQNLLRKSGKTLPRDCSVASFDGNNQSADEGLTTYTPDWALLGRTAVDFVINSAHNLIGNGIEVVIPGRLMIRDSVCSA